MISFDKAVEHIRSVATPLGKEVVPIGQARRRVLAAPVTARIDSPRSNVSVMDGYAVREADLGQYPAQLRVVGESFAGHKWEGTLRPGECARIFTGAPVPAGTDRVVVQENVRRDGDIATIDEDSGPARHMRSRGSDFRVGDELLPAGRMLDARAIVAAAAADLAEVECYRAPRVAILSTGDELAEPGRAAAGPDAIPDSVSVGVAAMACDWGAEVVMRTRLRDDLDLMCPAAAEAVEGADVVVVTGGASVGERDFAKAMLGPLGLDLIFSKVAIKPGKPVWLGRAGSTLVMGLPGNPTSALVTARLLLAPLLAGIGGRPIEAALDWRIATLAAPLKAGGDREIFHRARRDQGSVELLANQDSGAQRALAEANALIRQRVDAPPVAAGETVELLNF